MSNDTAEPRATSAHAHGDLYQIADLQLRREQLALERKKARAQNKAERLRMWLTAGSVVIPLLAAVFAYSADRARQHDLAQQEAERRAAEFKLKAVEIAMAGRAWDVPGRAQALKALFGSQLPQDFGDQFNPEEHGWGRDSKLEVMRLIAAHPEQSELILGWYEALFPGDNFLEEARRDVAQRASRQGRVGGQRPSR